MEALWKLALQISGSVFTRRVGSPSDGLQGDMPYLIMLKIRYNFNVSFLLSFHFFYFLTIFYYSHFRAMWRSTFPWSIESYLYQFAVFRLRTLPSESTMLVVYPCKRRRYAKVSLTITRPIDHFHKFQNAPVPYPIMLHSEKKFLFRMEHCGDMEQVHFGICELGQFDTAYRRQDTVERCLLWILGGNDGILLIRTIGTNSSEILIEIHTFSFKKIHLKMSSGKCTAILSRPLCVNSVWPSDAILRRRSGALAQVMACCLTVPSHYLNQCGLIISNSRWHSSGDNLTRDTSAINR